MSDGSISRNRKRGSNAGSLHMSTSPMAASQSLPTPISPTTGSSSSSPPAAPPTKSRQKPACEECRRRKLRCDGKKPKCSICKSSNVECNVNTERALRGPKKGYLTALQGQIAALESRLQAQERGQQLRWPDGTSLDSVNDMALIMPTPTSLSSSVNPQDVDMSTADSDFLMLSPTHSLPSDPHQGSIFNAGFDGSTIPSSFMSNMMLENLGDPTTQIMGERLTAAISSSSVAQVSLVSAAPIPAVSSSSSLSKLGDIIITELVQSELDQLYFDRVHPSVPILHQRRYLSWSRSISKSQSRQCLQNAIWTTASQLSPQYKHLQDTLYPEVKRQLTNIGLVPSTSGCQPSLDIEVAQAWILIATYEFIKNYHQEASISAGRAFRLVQLMGLHKIDMDWNEYVNGSSHTNTTTTHVTTDMDCSSNNNADSPSPSVTDTNFIAIEEKRRTYWVALLLESLCSMRNNLPLVLNEHLIKTALPVPDNEFQNGQAVQTAFLSDCISEKSRTLKSPLNECIMIVAMCSRTLSLVQKYSDDQDQQRYQSFPYDHAESEGAGWEQWLDNVLLARLHTLSYDYPSPTYSSDPTLLFANFLAQASVVYIWREISHMSGLRDRSALLSKYEKQAFSAAKRIVELAGSLTDFPYFKIHPFISVPLRLGVEFLSMDFKESMSLPLLRRLLDTLGRLTNVNDEHQSYIELLDLGHFTAIPSASASSLEV